MGTIQFSASPYKRTFLLNSTFRTVTTTTFPGPRTAAWVGRVGRVGRGGGGCGGGARWSGTMDVANESFKSSDWKLKKKKKSDLFHPGALNK